MYEAFYGFSEDPFRISPDYRFSYPHRSYLKAKNYLEYGLLRAEGIVVVTGEPGTGKSTVIDDLLSDYHSDELVVAKLLTTQINSYDLLRLLACSFGLEALSMDKAMVLTHLEQHLIQLFESDQRALLIVDEAQNLSIDSLEELRLLSNLQQYEYPLLQIFLIGQPKLQDLIRNPLLEQLRQRLVAACHFDPLNLEETQHYIEHRLSVVGWKQDPSFTHETFELIHRFSAGIPRRVNMICNRLLLHGHVESLHELEASDVRQVITELPPEMTVAEQTTELAAVTAAASSTLNRRNLPDGKTRKTQRVQVTETVRLHRHDAHETKPLDPSMTWPGKDQAEVALHPNTDNREPSDTSTKTLKRLIRRQQTDIDPLLSLTKERPSALTNDSESRHDTAAPTSTIHIDKPRRALPPNSATQATSIRIGRQLGKHRSWMRPIAAAIIFIAVFGMSYGYLRLIPGKYQYSPGMSFEADDPVANLKDPTGRITTLEADEDSETYNYTQKETSSDLLNLTLSSLLPGPENIKDMGISENISNDPPLPFQGLDAETALRSIQNQKHQNQVMEEESTQIIEEVIGEGNQITDKPSQDSQQRQFNNVAANDHEKRENRIPKNTENAKADFKAPQNIPHLDLKDTGIESKKGRLVIKRDLENALRHYTPMVERLSNGSLKITLRSELSFQSDSARLKNSASSILDKLAFVMRNYGGFLIQIVVQNDHRDTSTPQPEALSKKRADTIANHLIERGVSARRVQSEAYTENYPTPSNHDAQTRNGQHPEIGIYLQPQA